MTSSPQQPQPQALLTHRQFLHAIVRSLVRDDDGAEDVVQETLLRAWQRDGERPAPDRGWLTRVARNVGIDHLRGVRRRARLHGQLPAPGAAPSADEVLQHEEQRARLVQAVLALPQPYRGVVLLRFWEGLEPAQIAARLGIPGATVRSQLARGLTQLRERLDAEYGERRAWLAALAPFATPGAAPAATTLIPLLLMNTKLAFSSAALLVVGLCSWLWWRHEPAPPLANLDQAGTRTAAAATTGELATSDSPREATAADDAQRQAVASADVVTVRGQVLCQKKPHAGVALRLQWFAGYEASGASRVEVPLTADADGRFEWRGPRPEDVSTVRVLGDQPRLKVWNTPALVLPGTEEVVLEVSVIPLDRQLSGRVHDTAGAPVPGATLDVNGWPESAVTADAEGRYAMSVPVDTYPLLVTAPGFREQLVRGYMPKDATSHVLDIELQPGATITGRVVDAEGKPLANAEVGASGAFRRTRSDAQGHFTVHGVALGQRHILEAALAGFQTGGSMAVGGGEPVDIVMRPGRTVGIRALDQDGKPLVGATVKIIVELHRGASSKGVTRLDGRLQLQDLGDRPFTLIVEKPGFVAVHREVDATKVTEELLVPMQLGCTLRGQVVDDAGRPVAGVSIACELVGENIPMDRLSAGSRASTGEDGRFTIEGLPAVACRVRAFHRDYNRAAAEFVGGATHEVLLRLAPAPAVAGRVVDARTGAPLDEFTIVVAGTKDGRPVRADPVAFRDGDGYFVVRHWDLQAGEPVVVEAKADGYASSRIESVALAAPPRMQNLLQMSVGTRVEGVVLDARDGSPIAGVTVAVYRWDRRSAPGETCVTDTEGRFTLEHLEPGEHRLRLQREGYPEATSAPVVAASDVPVVTLTAKMSRGVTLRGRVPDAAGASDLTVRASSEGGNEVQGKVREDGTFELTGLPAANTLLSLSDAQRRTRYRRLEIGDADIAGFEFPLDAGTGSVRLDITGATSGNVHVTAIDEASPGRRAPALSLPFSQPQVVVRGLAPGRYRLSVDTRTFGEEGLVEVEVGTGETTATVEVRMRP